MSATAADKNAVARTIDTHCHLLPGLDDGPPTEARAVELARELVAAGVGTAVCTSHYSRRWVPTVELAQARLPERARCIQRRPENS